MAKEGLSVLVLEQFHNCGGYCQTIERNGYKFDTSIHSIYNWNYIADILESLGEKLEVVQITDENCFPDHRFDFRTIPQLRNDFKKFFPREANKIDQYYTELVEVMRQTLELQNPSSKFGTGAKYSLFAKYWGKTNQDVIENFFDNRELKSLIYSVQAGYMPNLPWLMSAYHLFMIRNYYHDLYLPKGGSQEIPNAFVRVLRNNGGEIALNSCVRKINIENGMATSVVLSDGRQISAKKAIVSNADANLTFRKLIGENNVDSDTMRYLNELDITPSYFVVNLGLDFDIRERDYNRTNIQYYPTYNTLNMYQSIEQGTIPENFWIWIGLPSLSDPSKAPPGKSTMFMSIFAPYHCENRWQVDHSYQFNGMEAIGDKGERHFNYIEELSNRVISRAEEVVPDISSHIEFKEIFTPLTYEETTFNYKAASVGWLQKANQMRHRGARLGLPVKSSIENLYLASGWTLTGAGCFPTILGGKLTAYEILKKDTSILYCYDWNARMVKE